MRILYGVTGCGLGHTMRARALASYLTLRGHDVLIAASSRAVPILRSHGLRVVAIDGMAMRFERGGVERTRTAIDLLRRAPRALATNMLVGLGEVRALHPDVALTDFDSFSHAIGTAMGVPVISLDHQHVVDRFVHPREVRATLSAYRVARAVVAAKTPACARYIVTSFFFPQERARRSTTLVGPIVRPEIERAVPTDGEHVLVYQTASGDPRLLPALAAVPSQRFVVYGLGAQPRRANVELRGFDEACFVRELASARAVIANGGFTTLSEAVYLRKPVLSVPIARQTEQEMNAAYVDYLGLGTRAKALTPSVVSRFLDRLPSFRASLDARIRRGTSDAFTAVDQALAEAA